MSRQLIAFIDCPHEGKRSESQEAQPHSWDRWPALEHARTGGFEHAILIASPRFRWDEVIAHVPDRPFPEAPTPIPVEPPAGERPASGAAPQVEDAPEAGPHEQAEATRESPAATESASESRASDATEGGQPDAPGSEAPAEAAAQAPPEPEGATASGTGPTGQLEPAGKPAEAGEIPSQPPAREGRPRERQPKKPGPEARQTPPPKSVDELRNRLHHMAQTGRIDRQALELLGEELARELGIGSIRCRVIPPFARDREQVSVMRSVLGHLKPQVAVALDFADGPRSTAALGVTLAHGLATQRPDVPLAELIVDRERSLGFHPRSLLHAIEIQELWRAAAHGHTSTALIEHLRADPRLQGLAAPCQRLARAIEFGNPAEAARAARTVHQRIVEMAERAADHEDWLAAVRPAIEAMTSGLLKEEPWSRRQLWMAEGAARRGIHFLSALHIREALVSALLETYGQNAARGWAPAIGTAEVPAEARVRPRDVMMVVLADPHSAKLVPDLGQVWQWVGNPRNRFLLTSPVAVDPALLRDANQALENVVALARTIVDEERFKAIVEVLPYEAAVDLAIGRNAVRVAPPRGKRGRRGDHAEGAHARAGGGHEPGAEASESGAPQGEAGAAAAGSAPPDAGPRPPRPGGTRFRPRPERRGPRPDRPQHGADRPHGGPDRPREVTAHGGRYDGPRGPRRDGGPESHPGSVPVGGIRHVERASSGLGNLGFALRNAGLVPTPRGPKERPPRKDGEAAEKPSSESATKEQAAAQSAQAPPEPSVAAAPPPAPPAPTAHEPAETQAPPPPAPDFDVAGPVSSEPPE